ncbi:MAG: aspartate--tRNA ligase, partial [Planctomycetia bacterium]
MADWRRSHTCGELRLDHEGTTVTLCGWVGNWRDHRGVVFIDLRDRYGSTQVVFHASRSADAHETARGLRGEYVVSVTGTVVRRGDENRNPKLATGEIELAAVSVTLLNRSDPSPFEIGEHGDEATEETRLRFRYLDLRRPRMQEIFLLRHRLNHTIREYFNALNFVEIETPILGRSTPEGARDFLVPSRVSPKTWYALPQSPQLYKQIMMVAGYDRYYQIARCFRDEDLRANRQPEFTQLDVEMSFVDHDDVMGLIEGLCIDIMRKCAGREITAPFTRLSWNDAMERFGCDKPDQRFGMEIVDVTAIGHESEFSVFRTVPAVRGLNAKGAAEKFTRKTLDELTEFAKEFGSKGLAWIKVETDKLN